LVNSLGERVNTLAERSGSPLMWNWTEKIVGKGAASRSKSPDGGHDPGKK
jgi:hypothetical protein